MRTSASFVPSAGRLVLVCNCYHLKRRHWCTKSEPLGRCLECGCPAFTPEDVCECNHGLKAHRTGHCHECACRSFRKKEKPWK